MFYKSTEMYDPVYFSMEELKLQCKTEQLQYYTIYNPVKWESCILYVLCVCIMMEQVSTMAERSG